MSMLDRPEVIGNQVEHWGSSTFWAGPRLSGIRRPHFVMSLQKRGRTPSYFVIWCRTPPVIVGQARDEGPKIGGETS